MTMLTKMTEVRAFLYAPGNNPLTHQVAYRENRVAALRAYFPDQKDDNRLPTWGSGVVEVPVWEHAGIVFRLLPSLSGGTWETRAVKHRFQFKCPQCSKWYSVGRVHQHKHRIRCWCGDRREEGARHYPGGNPENGYGHRAADFQTHCGFCGNPATKDDPNYVDRSKICARCEEVNSRTAFCGQVLLTKEDVEPHEKSCPMCKQLNEAPPSAG